MKETDRVRDREAGSVNPQTRTARRQDRYLMRDQADRYAFEVLNKTGGILEKLLNGVEEGKDQIRQGRQ